jgi:hypothetical protein
MVISLAIIQALIIYIVNDHIQKQEKLQEEVAVLREFRIEHAEHHKMEERAKKEKGG